MSRPNYKTIHLYERHVQQGTTRPAPPAAPKKGPDQCSTSKPDSSFRTAQTFSA